MSKKVLQIRAQRTDALRIENKSSAKAEIILYAGIGRGWDQDSMVSAKQFSDAMKTIGDDVSEITVRINSPGGDVFDGITIYNRLKQHKAKKIIYVDGMAASIASIIMLAGDEIVMSEGAQIMIHLPWTFAMGNRNELDNTINRLMDVEEQMLGIYARKTGMDKTSLRAMLEKETWMDAETAIDKGFADSKTEDEGMPIAASVMGAPWFHKALPRNLKMEASVVKSEINSLKNKIAGTLARKKA